MFKHMGKTAKINTFLTYCLSIGSLALMIVHLTSLADMPYFALIYSVFFLSSVNLVINLNFAAMEMPETEGIRKWGIK